MEGDAGPQVSVELRRGVITLAVLTHLRHENHGYGIRLALSQVGMPLKEGTLYPLLRRLESQGALSGRWDNSGDRLRKYYTLSERGRALLESLRKQRAILIEVVAELEKAGHEACRGPGTPEDQDALEMEVG